MLTEATVRSAKPAPKAYKRYDERGMFLFVTPSGARLWRLKYRIFGKEKLLALGAYPGCVAEACATEIFRRPVSQYICRILSQTVAADAHV